MAEKYSDRDICNTCPAANKGLTTKLFNIARQRLNYRPEDCSGPYSIALPIAAHGEATVGSNKQFCPKAEAEIAPEIYDKILLWIGGRSVAENFLRAEQFRDYCAQNNIEIETDTRTEVVNQMLLTPGSPIYSAETC